MIKETQANMYLKKAEANSEAYFSARIPYLCPSKIPQSDTTYIKWGKFSLHRS
jgi:hypothetical protein